MREYNLNDVVCALEQLNRIEEMLVGLCERAGAPVVKGEEDETLRAFITTDSGLWWYDVEATKCRALGMEARDELELGLRAVYWLMGWTKQNPPEPDSDTRTYGQYL